MTKKECLTKLILSREYNPDCKCVNYNSDLRILKKVCKNQYSVSISGQNAINSICDIDKVMWNMMCDHCNQCKFCDGNDLEKTECVLKEKDVSVFFAQVVG